MEAYPINKIYRQLESGPVLLMSTKDNNVSNVMTIGFQMMVQHDPPLVGIIVGPWDHSYKTLMKNRECVLSIPGVDIIEKVVDIGNCSGSTVNKFDKFDLKIHPSSIVKAPLIKDCLCNIECIVVNNDLVNQYNLFILEVVAVWINTNKKEVKSFHHNGNGIFSINGEFINLQDRMIKWKMFQD